MSVLRKTLNRITEWFRQNNPEEIARLQPGLTYQEIEAIAEKLPFQLPEDIYELYQWRNGRLSRYWDEDDKNPWIFAGTSLQALQRYQIPPGRLIIEDGLCYIENYSLQEDIYISDKIEGPYRFEIFRSVMPEYSMTIGYISIDRTASSSSVIFEEVSLRCEFESFIWIKYDSLTTLMLTVAECYEKEVDRDDDKFHEVYCKYNPKSWSEKEIECKKIRAASLVKSNELIRKLETNLSIETLIDIQRHVDLLENTKAVDLLIDALKIPLSRIPDPSQNTDIRETAATILGNLGNIKAVEPLIQALQEKDWTIRASAARALGRIKDKRAVEPLIMTLTDSHKAVRKAAVFSLAEMEAENTLTAALEHQDKKVRNRVKWALEEIRKLRENDVPF